MTSWDFHNPVRVAFGTGCRSRLVPQLHGHRLVIVSTARGRDQLMHDPHLAALGAGAFWVDSVTPNPGLAETQAEIDRLVGHDFDAILAFGGGSAMDAAKALAAALTPGIATHDLHQLITAPAEYLVAPTVPVHAIPTTSGTGAEVTPFATIWDHNNRKKLSLASPLLFPTTATVDPELTHGSPRDVALSTGLDALNQAFESLWNRNRTPLSQMVASRAVGLALGALPRLAASPEDTAARVGMAEASLLAGMAISQTRTALCHSISYPLTAHFGLAHGWACAVTMVAVAELAFAAAPVLFDQVARMADIGTAADLLARLQEVTRALGVREIARRSIPDIAAVLTLLPEMFTPGRSDNFIIPVESGQLETILMSSLQNRN